MANEIGIKVALNWFTPKEPDPLLPKDLLRNSKKIQGEEAEAQILQAVKNYRGSMYSHATSTHGFPAQMGSGTAAGPWAGWTASSYITTAASTNWHA